MALTESGLAQAETRLASMQRRGYAIRARYDKRSACIVVDLHNGVRIIFPPHLAEGLDRASPTELADIEIAPGGLGLHWPRLDADLYIPGILQGQFGSRGWMAAQLGKRGGKIRTSAKAAAARANGRKGGRPRVRA